VNVDKSVSVRNYAVAALCIAAIIGVFGYVGMTYNEINNNQRYERDLEAYARCETSTFASINIETYRTDLKNVSCTSLDPGLFINEVVVLGDMNKGSNDICTFKATEKINVPARFEIKYNDGQVIKKACERGWILE